MSVEWLLHDKTFWRLKEAVLDKVNWTIFTDTVLKPHDREFDLIRWVTATAVDDMTTNEALKIK